MAGSTGSSISSELPPAREGELQGHPDHSKTYSIRFINYAPEPLQTPSFIENGEADSRMHPSSGFALKKASRKRVVFSLEQKEIMISFYNRQASTGIRAEPKDVIACMQAKGLEPLKESQIVSWWSTYHQKRKQLLTTEADYLRGLHATASPSGSTVPVQQTPAQATGSTMPTQQTTPAQASGSNVPSQQTTSAQVTGCTVPTQHTTPAQGSGSSAPSQQITSAQVTSCTVPSQHTTPAQAPGSNAPNQQTTSAQAIGCTVPTQHTTPAQAPGSNAPSQQTTSAQAIGCTVPTQHTTPAQAPGSNAPSQHTTSAQAIVCTVPTQHTTPAQAPGSTVSVHPSSSCLTGNVVPGHADILQWTFPGNFCQSTLGGRSGSNACTFIALYFGHLYHHRNLPPPVHSSLSMEWKCALHKAITKGNEIHDELFEGEGVDVAVADAVEMAGAECFVQSIGQGLNMLGMDCVDQLAEVFEASSLSATVQSSCGVIVTTGRSFLFIANQDGSCMIVDSHRHGNNTGAIIGYCAPNCAKVLAKWLESMLQETWQSNLRVCSVTPIFYRTP